jgi:hypothetical protein
MQAINVTKSVPQVVDWNWNCAAEPYPLSRYSNLECADNSTSEGSLGWLATNLTSCGQHYWEAQNPTCLKNIKLFLLYLLLDSSHFTKCLEKRCSFKRQIHLIVQSMNSNIWQDSFIQDLQWKIWVHPLIWYSHWLQSYICSSIERRV